MKRFLFGFVLCLMMAGGCLAASPDVAVNARFCTIRPLPGADIVYKSEKCPVSTCNELVVYPRESGK